jgi:hypothetical protein
LSWNVLGIMPGAKEWKYGIEGSNGEWR